MRTFIPFALAVMLALTSQAMAVARGSADATGQMVLCIGAGTVTVYTDADGAPTSAPHICPDCALSVVFTTGSPFAAAPETLVAVHRSRRLAALCVPASQGLVPQTRAPPAFV